MTTIDVTSGRIPPAAWATLAVTSVAVFMVSLEVTVISLAFPDIQAAFPEADTTTLSWVFTAYNIGVASLLLLSGWLADRLGRKRVFLAGLVVFALGSLGSGSATSAAMLIAMRVVQAAGGSALFPAGLALLLPAFPPARRQLAVGVWGAMGGMAAAVGPTLGALLIDAAGWRWVFLINVPVAAVAVVAGLRVLHESRADHAARGVDFVSVPLAALGVGLLVLAITKAADWGWTSTTTIGCLVLSALMLAAFAVRSLRHPNPLFDLRLFRLRTFAVANLGSLLFATAFFGWLVFLPSFLQQVWGWSVLEAGFAIAPGPLVSGLLSGPVGSVSDRIGNRPVLAAGGLCGAAGMAIHVAFVGTDPDYAVLLPALVLIGLAGAASFAGLTGAAMREIPPPRYAMAGAGRTTIFQLAVALGIAVAVALIGQPASPEQAVDAYRTSWFTSGVLYGLLSVLFVAAYPAHRRIAHAV